MRWSVISKFYKSINLLILLHTKTKIYYCENDCYKSKIDSKINKIGGHPMIDNTIGNRIN